MPPVTSSAASSFPPSPISTGAAAFRFREPPTRLFHLTALAQAEPNWLVFRLNRPEGIDVYLQAKEPGLELQAGTARLHTAYGTAGGETSAYEQLLLEAGDQWRLLAPRPVRSGPDG